MASYQPAPEDIFAYGRPAAELVPDAAVLETGGACYADEAKADARACERDLLECEREVGNEHRLARLGQWIVATNRVRPATVAVWYAHLLQCDNDAAALKLLVEGFDREWTLARRFRPVARPRGAKRVDPTTPGTLTPLQRLVDMSQAGVDATPVYMRWRAEDALTPAERVGCSDRAHTATLMQAVADPDARLELLNALMRTSVTDVRPSQDALAAAAALWAWLVYALSGMRVRCAYGAETVDRVPTAAYDVLVWIDRADRAPRRRLGVVLGPAVRPYDDLTVEGVGRLVAALQAADERLRPAT
jgi:hypothetical protein